MSTNYTQVSVRPKKDQIRGQLQIPTQYDQAPDRNAFSEGSTSSQWHRYGDDRSLFS